MFALLDYCRAARMRATITTRVAIRFFFFAWVSKHQSGQSIARSVNSSVNITKAAQCLQMLGSPGLGWVDLLSDQRSECPHSGHCHIDSLRNGM
jgi:hypothetical protein